MEEEVAGVGVEAGGLVDSTQEDAISEKLGNILRLAVGTVGVGLLDPGDIDNVDAG